MSKLAIEVGTPISCFVNAIDSEAHVTFFAQNGQEDGFCGHGLISVIKHLKENNLSHVTALISASGVRLNAKVLENGMSSLEIPVGGFQISSWNLPDFANFFELQKQEILETFRTNPLGDIAVEVSTPEALKNIMLDAKKVDEFSKEHNIRIFVFFCKGSSFELADVEIRVFCSKLYELEDIVCGSANISVSNILFRKYGISKYKVIQPFNYLKTGKVGGYQEIEYLPKKQILILNGFAELKKERFIFEPLDIEFDEACNPVLRNEDYHFLRSILTDIEVMKTSTDFACGLPETKEEKLLIEERINKLNETSDSFEDQVISVFELANKSYELFKSSESEDKRKIINLLFPNLQMDGKKVLFSLQKPLQEWIELKERSIWLPLLTTIRTKRREDVSSLMMFLSGTKVTI